jgi:hypothetical protein
VKRVGLTSFRFKNILVSGGGLRGRTSALAKPKMDFGSPTLNACLMLTFVSWSRDKKVHVADHESRAEALLENVEGKYGINEVNVQPSIVLTSEPDIELLG